VSKGCTKGLVTKYFHAHVSRQPRLVASVVINMTDFLMETGGGSDLHMPVDYPLCSADPHRHHLHSINGSGNGRSQHQYQPTSAGTLRLCLEPFSNFVPPKPIFTPKSELSLSNHDQSVDQVQDNDHGDITNNNTSGEGYDKKEGRISIPLTISCERLNPLSFVGSPSGSSNSMGGIGGRGKGGGVTFEEPYGLAVSVFHQHRYTGQWS